MLHDTMIQLENVFKGYQLELAKQVVAELANGDVNGVPYGTMRLPFVVLQNDLCEKLPVYQDKMKELAQNLVPLRHRLGEQGAFNVRMDALETFYDDIWSVCSRLTEFGYLEQGNISPGCQVQDLKLRRIMTNAFWPNEQSSELLHSLRKE